MAPQSKKGAEDDQQPPCDKEFSDRSEYGSSGRSRAGSQASDDEQAYPNLPISDEHSSFSSIGEQFESPETQNPPLLSDSELDDPHQGRRGRAQPPHPEQPRRNPRSQVAQTSRISSTGQRTDDGNSRQSDARSSSTGASDDHVAWNEPRVVAGPSNPNARHGAATAPRAQHRDLSFSSLDFTFEYVDFDDSSEPSENYVVASGSSNSSAAGFESIPRTPGTSESSQKGPKSPK